MATEAERAKLLQVNPEFSEVLKNMPPRPPMGTDVVAIRAVTSGRVQARRDATQTFESTKGVVEKDIAIPTRDGGSIQARIHRPETPPTSGSPLVVVYHGGGFIFGNLDSDELNCQLFSKHYGAVCVNVDYRLAPEAPFPAAPNDAWDALTWAAANAKEVLGADPSKGFIVCGTSAGGNLTDVVAHLARDEKLNPPLTGLIELVPAVCPYERMPEKYRSYYTSHTENENAPVLPQAAVDFMVQQLQPDYDNKLYVPFNWPGGHSDLPPVFFQICGTDILRDEALIYEKVLREEYGVKTKVKTYPGLPHGFWSFFPGMKASHQFIRDTLEGFQWVQDQHGK